MTMVRFCVEYHVHFCGISGNLCYELNLNVSYFSELDSLRKENQNLSKQKEEFRAQINNFSSPSPPEVSRDELLDVIDNIHV